MIIVKFVEIMQHEAFLSAKFDTGFIEKYFTPEKLISENEEEEGIAAFFASFVHEKKSVNPALQSSVTEKRSNWKLNRS